MKNRNKSADAAVTGAVLWFLGICGWLLMILGPAIICGAWLVPYTVEHWAAWFGHTIVVEWWKGVIVGIVVGMITRTGIIYISIVTALITLVFSVLGFTGF